MYNLSGKAILIALSIVITSCATANDSDKLTYVEKQAILKECGKPVHVHKSQSQKIRRGKQIRCKRDAIKNIQNTG